ncbi:MAG: pentapeptide repeat-containing protein [Bdellovibrionales bacterium]|jgi:uncharacterized protein YjbI with pentapeptide repeats|nr:pentapeptide repeat-containing protein [Bdellovibrionales bacterium]
MIKFIILFLTLVSSSYGEEYYSYNDDTQQCENNKGEIGHNTIKRYGRISECSDLTKVKIGFLLRRRIGREDILKGLLLEKANFTKGKLSKKEIVGVKASYSNFNQTTIKRSRLSFSEFKGTFAQNITFKEVQISNTDFSNALLRRSNFQETTIYESDFSGANLKHAVFNKVEIKNSKFLKSNMKHVDLKDAILIDCDFSGSNLINADLRGADLSTSNLDDTTLYGALINRETRLPFSLDVAIKKFSMKLKSN